jgi:hypothetical protein
MLTPSKLKKSADALKKYSKKYLGGHLKELDESGTRLMINEFLTEVLGYAPIEEVKTEYMIKGTYADYVIQLKGVRHFLVEVKALSLNLSDAHLRQAVNYGANEGIEWALLTNGKCFNLYKILFNKPIESRKMFSIDLSDPIQLKNAIESIQFLHKDSVSNKGLDLLWNKCAALDPANVAGFLYTPNVINYIKKSLKDNFKQKFTDEEIKIAIDKIVFEAISLDNIKHVKAKRAKTKNTTNGNVAPESNNKVLEERFEIHETTAAAEQEQNANDEISRTS